MTNNLDLGKDIKQKVITGCFGESLGRQENCQECDLFWRCSAIVALGELRAIVEQLRGQREELIKILEAIL